MLITWRKKRIDRKKIKVFFSYFKFNANEFGIYKIMECKNNNSKMNEGDQLGTFECQSKHYFRLEM